MSIQPVPCPTKGHPIEEPRIVAKMRKLTNQLLCESGNGYVTLKLHYYRGKFMGESVEVGYGKERV